MAPEIIWAVDRWRPPTSSTHTRTCDWLAASLRLSKAVCAGLLSLMRRWQADVA